MLTPSPNTSPFCSISSHRLTAMRNAIRLFLGWLLWIFAILP